jgi:hypothetical protein
VSPDLQHHSVRGPRQGWDERRVRPVALKKVTEEMSLGV